MYHIAESSGIKNINNIFEGWIIYDKEESGSEVGNKPSTLGQSGNKIDEMILIKCKEGLNDLNLFGCFGQESKWMKLASLNLDQLGCKSLRDFVGFANGLMAFETDPIGLTYNIRGCPTNPSERKDVILIPLNGDEPRKIGSGCEFCLQVTTSDSDTPCPHIYFTAWNELYCLFPQTEVHCALKPQSYDDNDIDERFMVGYQISKYSSGHNIWTKCCNLVIPPVYNYSDPNDKYIKRRPDFEVVHCKFRVITNDTHLLLTMVNTGVEIWPLTAANKEKYITVLQLTPDTSGELKSELKFHSKTKEPEFYSRASISATSQKLTFREMTFQRTCPPDLYLHKKPPSFGHVTELNLTTGKLNELDLEDQVQQNDDDNDTDRSYESDGNYEFVSSSTDFQFVTSSQTGLLYYIDIEGPYLATMYSFDPVNNEWKSLPGSPKDDYSFRQAYIHPIPQELIPELSRYPQAIFEDKRNCTDHGPFVRYTNEDSDSDY